MTRRLAIGLDYGTNSVRAVVVDCGNGQSIATSVFDYPVFMQIYADVLGSPMLIAASPQTPAQGAAIAAAVAAGTAAGGYDRFEDAQAGMAVGTARTYMPDSGARTIYDELYGLYRELHDAFGGVAGARADLGTLMKRLLALRDRVVAATGTP